MRNVILSQNLLGEIAMAALEALGMQKRKRENGKERIKEYEDKGVERRQVEEFLEVLDSLNDVSILRAFLATFTNLVGTSAWNDYVF